MLQDADKYAYRVIWSPDDGEFVGLCTEFPGLSWLAASFEAAAEGVRDLVRDCVAEMSRKGEAVPEPICMRDASIMDAIQLAEEQLLSERQRPAANQPPMLSAADQGRPPPLPLAASHASLPP